MSTTNLTPDTRRNVVLFSAFVADPRVKKFKKQKDDGTQALILQGVPVFRSGTFRDSMGYQHTWDDIHMQQMVNHWNLLRDRKILESVPVRKGHGSFLGDPMDGLIGWHTNLSAEKRKSIHDDKEYTFLDADFEILDADAIKNIDSGLWRNLSSEISSYVTNDEMEFWPVYSGVAYVDFSAVEGLREFSKNSKQFSLMFENETEAPAVGDQNNNGPAQGTSGTGEGQTQPTQQSGTTPPAQTGDQGTTASSAEQTGGEQQGTETTEGTDSTDHSKGGTEFVFKLNGKPTVGVPISGLSGVQLQAFMSAQSHIDGLEQYRIEQIKTNRENFVKGLASGDKPQILASQIPGLTKAALAMDDAAYADWSAAYSLGAAAPASSSQAQQLLQQHGAQPGDSNQPQSQPEGETAERIEILESIVADHRRSGFSKEQLEATSSWQELQGLLAQQNKS